MIKLFYPFLILLATVFSVQAQKLTSLPNTSAAKSSNPNLQVLQNGKVYLSWQEKAPEKRLLHLAPLAGDKFDKSQSIQPAARWYTSWSDPASITAFGKKSLVATMSIAGEKKYSQYAGLIISNDQGKTWSKPIITHEDRTATEHGFISIVPAKGNKFWAIWLDGRAFEELRGKGMGYTTVRAALFDKNGKKTKEQIIDNRVCDCCQTTAIKTSAGVLVMYRNRDKKEQRDIGYVLFSKGKWSKPQNLANDGWVIKGCPVNGPSVASRKSKVAVAWFTMGKKQPRVQLSFSADGGKTFDRPVLLDKKEVMGRVNTKMLRNGDAIVSYVTNENEKRVAKIIRVSPEGRQTPLATIDSLGNSNDFPKMALVKNKLYLTWSEQADKKSVVKTAVVEVK